MDTVAGPKDLLPNFEPVNGSSDGVLGSPLKKARSHFDQNDSTEKYTATQSLTAALDSITGNDKPTESTEKPSSSLKMDEEEL